MNQRGTNFAPGPQSPPARWLTSGRGRPRRIGARRGGPDRRIRRQRGEEPGAARDLVVVLGGTLRGADLCLDANGDRPAQQLGAGRVEVRAHPGARGGGGRAVGRRRTGGRSPGALPVPGGMTINVTSARGWVIYVGRLKIPVVPERPDSERDGAAADGGCSIRVVFPTGPRRNGPWPVCLTHSEARRTIDPSPIS